MLRSRAAFTTITASEPVEFVMKHTENHNAQHGFSDDLQEPFELGNQSPQTVRFDLDDQAASGNSDGDTKTLGTSSAAVARTRSNCEERFSAAPKSRTPLFRLAQLTSKERRVNQRKLK